MTATHCPTSKRRERGLSMIEVLVSLVIMAIGLLGVGGLIVNGLRLGHSSANRSSAVQLAHEMGDRIRANQAGVGAGSYNSLSAAVTDPGCIASGCTTAQLATYDYYRLRTDAAAYLPAGTITVTGASGIFTIRIFWDDDRSGATGTGCTSAATDLKCFQLTVRAI